MEGTGMSVSIELERPNSPDAMSLIGELEAHLESIYPRESRHGLNIEQLLAQSVAFFLLRADGAPAACGGIKLVGSEYGELKRMYVRPQFRGRGFGDMLLEQLAGYAHARGVGLLRLETGVHQRAAIRMYERAGFYRIAPFANYTNDPLSLCYEKSLT
jgi:ribosomal protein S18 acetylase RimI-like enzyme